MADPLSLTTSIISVITAGVTVASGFRELADDIGSAGTEIGRYSDEVQALTKLLEHVLDAVETFPTTVSVVVEHSLLNEVLDICGRILQPLCKMSETLRMCVRHLKEGNASLRQFGEMAKWVFAAKKKVLFIRGALDVQHRLLDTNLQLILLRTTGQAELRADQEKRLEGAVNKLAERIHTPNNSPMSASHQSQDSGIRTGNNVAAIKETGEEVISAAFIPRFQSGPWMNSPPRPECFDQGDGIDQSDIEAIDRQIDRDLGGPRIDSYEQEIEEDVRVLSRRMIKRADQVLTASRGAESEGMRDATSEGKPFVPSEGRKKVAPEAKTNIPSEGKPFVTLQGGKNAPPEAKTEIPSEAKPNVTSAAKPDVTSEAKPNVQSGAKPDVKSEVKSEATTEVPSIAPPPPSGNQPGPVRELGEIRIKTMDRISLLLPKEAVRTLRPLLDLLKETCPARAGEIDSGRYRILDETGAIVRFEFWEHLVTLPSLKTAFVIFGSAAEDAQMLQQIFRFLARDANGDVFERADEEERRREEQQAIVERQTQQRIRDEMAARRQEEEKARVKQAAARLGTLRQSAFEDMIVQRFLEHSRQATSRLLPMSESKFHRGVAKYPEPDQNDDLAFAADRASRQYSLFLLWKEYKEDYTVRVKWVGSLQAFYPYQWETGKW